MKLLQKSSKVFPNSTLEKEIFTPSQFKTSKSKEYKVKFFFRATDFSKYKLTKRNYVCICTNFKDLKNVHPVPFNSLEIIKIY